MMLHKQPLNMVTFLHRVLPLTAGTASTPLLKMTSRVMRQNFVSLLFVIVTHGSN